MLRFTSDPHKAATNLHKHGVSFGEAATVFEDPLAAGFYDHSHSEDEPRSALIGWSDSYRLLYVVYTEPQPQPWPDQVVRIIGARLATATERREHEHSF